MDYERFLDNLSYAILMFIESFFLFAHGIADCAKEESEPLKGILLALAIIIAVLPIACLAALVIWALTH
ncbi:hypothetical protein N7456_003209 [Penicillium angulare]|uniref:Uncharacterized protein n=1 Tax=Penicillium angulare TaxID=116970 RepID=A0A9W9FUD8_9EURO|nr:hypothetical protein N7456_003209 [Penicillium angulare]